MKNKNINYDTQIDNWLSQNAIEPKPNSIDDIYQHAIKSRYNSVGENSWFNLSVYNMQLVAAAVIVIMSILTVSQWGANHDNGIRSDMYLNAEYINMEELIIINQTLEPLAFDEGAFRSEYYW